MKFPATPEQPDRKFQIRCGELVVGVTSEQFRQVQYLSGEFSMGRLSQEAFTSGLKRMGLPVEEMVKQPGVLWAQPAVPVQRNPVSPRSAPKPAPPKRKRTYQEFREEILKMAVNEAI